MKKKQWAQSFSLIDEKYVEEADPMRDAGRVLPCGVSAAA